MSKKFLVTYVDRSVNKLIEDNGIDGYDSIDQGPVCVFTEVDDAPRIFDENEADDKVREMNELYHECTYTKWEIPA